LNKPWIDGAIEQINGAARVFVPDGPCYECTMSETDWKLLQHRRSCNLLSRPEMEGGKTPTTPTVSSIVAGVQTQEAVKLLHGLDVIAGRGWVFNGLSAEAYHVEYQRKDSCYSHDALDEVIALPARADTMTVAGLLEEAKRRLGPGAELEFGRDVLEKLVCPKCGAAEELFTSLGRVSADKAWCTKCPDTRREVVTFYKIRGDEGFVNRTLAQVGVPPFDIVIARAPREGRSIGLELAWDATDVLGPLSGAAAPSGGTQGTEGLEWK
jgi:adenylyltransferase/sulfurtransferase